MEEIKTAIDPDSVLKDLRSWFSWRWAIVYWGHGSQCVVVVGAGLDQCDRTTGSMLWRPGSLFRSATQVSYHTYEPNRVPADTTLERRRITWDASLPVDKFRCHVKAVHFYRLT